MPELPEVETMCRGIRDIVGRTITEVITPRRTRRPSPISPRPALLAKQLRGRQIKAVKRIGKRAVVELLATRSEPSAYLVIEPRMTGLLLRVAPPTEQHVRLVVSLSNDNQCHSDNQPLIFWDRRGLGTIRLLDDRALATRCGPPAVGPDALRLDGPELYAAIHSSRRAIKVALLDQRVTAGIGNIYAAEMLFAAGIDPRSRCNRLSRATCDHLAFHGRAILQRAIRLEGSSIGDETYRTADNRPGRFQRCHQVYGRDGSACPQCGTTIRRVIQAQRSTCFCPQCQKRL
jgi:formamidopyrimidine-DNA glycosylase